MCCEDFSDPQESPPLATVDTTTPREGVAEGSFTGLDRLETLWFHFLCVLPGRVEIQPLRDPLCSLPDRVGVRDQHLAVAH